MTGQSNHENRRHELIYEMERLYLQHPFSDAELGERLGTDRSNVHRIRKIMTEKMGIPIEADPTRRGRYFLPKRYSISHIPLSREQAAVLYLGARRLQQQTRTSQRHVVDALEKLSHALHKPLAEGLVKAAEIVLNQEQDPQQAAVFATLVECWLEGIRVRIRHRKLHGRLRTYTVSPYQLEPSVWGDGIYLIGHSDYHGKLATFKTARIEKATPTTERFEIPEDFDVHELLNHAWGIWHADEEPVTVRLHFNQEVAPRVRETLWHPQQRIIPQEDGSCIWETDVAEWQEMVPWVRGWGASVEVLAPAALRETLIGEAKVMAERYGWHVATSVDRGESTTLRDFYGG